MKPSFSLQIQLIESRRCKEKAEEDIKLETTILEEKPISKLELWERSEIQLHTAEIRKAKLFGLSFDLDVRYKLEKEYNCGCTNTNVGDRFYTPRIWQEVCDDWDEAKSGAIEESELWNYPYKLHLQLENSGLFIMGLSEKWVGLIMRFLGGKKDIAVDTSYSIEILRALIGRGWIVCVC